jgi:hypothetical protein
MRGQEIYYISREGLVVATSRIEGVKAQGGKGVFTIFKRTAPQVSDDQNSSEFWRKYKLTTFAGFQTPEFQWEKKWSKFGNGTIYENKLRYVESYMHPYLNDEDEMMKVKIIIDPTTPETGEPYEPKLNENVAPFINEPAEGEFANAATRVLPYEFVNPDEMTYLEMYVFTCREIAPFEEITIFYHKEKPKTLEEKKSADQYKPGYGCVSDLNQKHLEEAYKQVENQLQNLQNSLSNLSNTNGYTSLRLLPETWIVGQKTYSEITTFFEQKMQPEQGSANKQMRELNLKISKNKAMLDALNDALKQKLGSPDDENSEMDNAVDESDLDEDRELNKWLGEAPQRPPITFEAEPVWNDSKSKVAKWSWDKLKDKFGWKNSTATAHPHPLLQPIKTAWDKQIGFLVDGICQKIPWIFLKNTHNEYLLFF